MLVGWRQTATVVAAAAATTKTAIWYNDTNAKCNAAAKQPAAALPACALTECLCFVCISLFGRNCELDCFICVDILASRQVAYTFGSPHLKVQQFELER